MVLWKQPVGWGLISVKEPPTNEVDTNAVAVVHTKSQCKEEVVYNRICP